MANKARHRGGMARRKALHVSLPADLALFVEARVRSSIDSTPSAVIEHALRLLQTAEALPTASVAGTKRAIEIGLAQLRRGEGIDGEAFFSGLALRRRAKRTRAVVKR